MEIVHGKDLAFSDISLKHRNKGLAFKNLFVGQENTPENHLLALVRSIGFYSPRHKHNFDQFRYAYKGEISISPDKNAVEGELVYHPEGVHYGPQQDSEGERVVLILQFGGTSGQGFLSYRQLEEGQKELAQLGHFEGGKFYRNGRQEADEPQDGYEALWEKFNGRKLIYPPGRYKDPIIMSPVNYAWRPADNLANTDGMTFKKPLGVFTERETRAEMIKMKQLGRFSIASENAIRLIFILSGAGEAEGQPWEEESAIRVSPGKEVVLSAHRDTEILLFTLPLLDKY
ncbi:hypothetical protein TASIC1_0011018300 [Trichoderma asperellum]|uniref:Uncharacterized protein n=1 Tax=Trichoderma asperellum TaxID=101201 RepID=A0A6V8R3Z2_TRIAP|nr:hypothetical protein LI328DRAFT_68446 [Trichoderma asperelloides]GFP58816.1 hypothetical protein TASIC1_0011018300 [Trichoderma asperellum]